MAGVKPRKKPKGKIVNIGSSRSSGQKGKKRQAKGIDDGGGKENGSN